MNKSFKCPLIPCPKWCSKQCDKINENDEQKIRLYCFEESLLSHPKLQSFPKTLTLSDCREIVNDVAQKYSIPVPEVKDGRGLHSAKGGYNKFMKLNIKLPKQYRYPLAVLHETAHCIMQYHTRYSEDDLELHGKIYTQYLLKIYADYFQIPIQDLQFVANKFNLLF